MHRYIAQNFPSIPFKHNMDGIYKTKQYSILVNTKYFCIWCIRKMTVRAARRQFNFASQQFSFIPRSRIAFISITIYSSVYKPIKAATRFMRINLLSTSKCIICIKFLCIRHVCVCGKYIYMFVWEINIFPKFWYENRSSRCYTNDDDDDDTRWCCKRALYHQNVSKHTHGGYSERNWER